MGSLYALKPLLQHKSKTRKAPFSFQTLYYSFIALPYFIKSNLSNAHYVLNYMVTKNMALITKPDNLFLFICIINLLCRCGDIKTNLHPKYSSLTFCHWNLNDLIGHDSIKISKRGRVCIYYKERIPLIKRDDICTLDNCLVTEIRFKGEK